MGELKKQQLTVESRSDRTIVGSVRQLNERMREFLYEPNNERLSTYLEQFELSTGLRREQLAYGAIGIFAFYCIIGSFAQIICNAIGFGYPAYASVKAIRTANKEDDTKWLIYWTVFAFFSLIDFFAGTIMHWFPAYWLAKILFLLYLYLPQTNGALYLYENYVDDFITCLDAHLFKDKKQ
ncbi:Receptor expression-enhancing protein [Aphelenchoides bicaudatus]|nr:Receptor expression-enhancing protein [Aphelenchoides bicaudatus]